MTFTAMAMSHYFAFKAGRKQGQYDVAKHIPEIRRLERLNVLAPRIEE